MSFFFSLVLSIILFRPTTNREEKERERERERKSVHHIHSFSLLSPESFLQEMDDSADVLSMTSIDTLTEDGSSFVIPAVNNNKLNGNDDDVEEDGHDGNNDDIQFALCPAPLRAANNIMDSTAQQLAVAAATAASGITGGNCWSQQDDVPPEVDEKVRDLSCFCFFF